MKQTQEEPPLLFGDGNDRTEEHELFDLARSVLDLLRDRSSNIQRSLAAVEIVRVVLECERMIPRRLKVTGKSAAELLEERTRELIGRSGDDFGA